MLPKVREFLWRVLRSILPTYERLRSNKIKDVDEYIRCEEDDKHVLVNCHKAKELWRSEGFKEVVVNILIITFIFRLYNKLIRGKIQMFALNSWKLCFARNQKFWKILELSTFQIIQQVGTILD